MEAQHSSLLLLIPLFPLIGATINGLAGSWIQRTFGKRAVHGIGILMPAISAVLSWILFFQLMGLEPEQRAFRQVGWDWLHVGFVDAAFAFWLDPLSSLMTLIITTIGTMIHVYSVGYMSEEPAYWRFFCYLNLFVTMMLILVLGDNFIVMFIGWEGVGLASYLLIGFWYKEMANAAAGMKAFVVNRFGDACFVIGLFTLFWGLQGSWAPSIRAVDAEPNPLTELAPDYFWNADAKAAEDALGSKPEVTEHEEEGTVHATLTFHRMRKIFDGEVTREALRLELFAAHEALIDGRETELDLVPDHEARVAHIAATANLLKAHDQATDARLAAFDVERGRSSITEKSLWGVPLLFLVCLLFFLGATAKSAQIPFYVWLPDAMAGPTPVSALIHAATMVTAGVYMIARLNFLFGLSPGACTVVGLVGAMTALFAATMGLFQYDIKKVLAYSTVSQLGFMFIGVGVGAYWAGIFHLLTHACFKACLFLGSGSVILGCHHEQDMRRMGGLAKYMPSTRWTYAFACLAIAGFPLFAGFCSKDEILWKAFTASSVLPYVNYLIWGMGIVAATLTAFYMYRSYYMTFSGEYRGNDVPLDDPYPADTARAKDLLQPKPISGPSPEVLAALAAHGHDDHGHAHGHDDHGHGHDDHGHGHDDHHGGVPHESPSSMTGPLWVLGIASLILGVVVGFPPVVSSLLGLHIHPAIEVWLEPVLAPGIAMMALYDTHTPGTSWLHDEHTKHLFEYALAAISVLVATGGWLAARWLYKDNANPLPERLLKDPRGVLADLPLVGRFIPAEAGDGVTQLHRLIYNKYFVDEAYYTVMIRGLSYVWNGLRNFDVYVVDGAVNSVAFIGKYVGYIQGAIDKYLVDGAVNAVADLVMRGGQKLRTLQTGQIRSYLLGAFGGALAAVLLIVALL